MFATEARMSAERTHRSSLRRFLAHTKDSYAAACAYEDLRHLSDADLSRRGLSRATLAADLLRSQERQ
jgi:hypothetical protein